MSNIGARRPWIAEYSPSHEYFENCTTDDEIIKVAETTVIKAFSKIYKREVGLCSVMIIEERYIWNTN